MAVDDFGRVIPDDTPTLIVKPRPSPTSPTAPPTVNTQFDESQFAPARQQDSDLPAGFGGSGGVGLGEGDTPPRSTAGLASSMIGEPQPPPTVTQASIDQAINKGISATIGLPDEPPSVTTQEALPKEEPAPDIRIRLGALHPQDVYGGQSNSILAPLNETSGMLFPYTPAITFTQGVNYMDLQLVHSNTDYAAYTRTPSVTISLNGKFTVQNQTEGRYALACLHFLRTASKCYFGKLDKEKAGLPPPILVLSGYGIYIFNNLRVILKNHSWSFDESIDAVNVIFPSGVARLPTLFTVTCELTVVQTPQRMREKFSFDLFASGKLMESTGWI